MSKTQIGHAALLKASVLLDGLTAIIDEKSWEFSLGAIIDCAIRGNFGNGRGAAATRKGGAC
jgi:hypothetical protein